MKLNEKIIEVLEAGMVKKENLLDSRIRQEN